jgi:DNA topoisomerase-1
MSLLIVESPAKCSKIQGFLGSGWKVIATMGHIRALDETLDAVGLDRDFEPRFQFLKTKAKAIAAIKDAAKGRRVFLAADDDREGEAIAYSVMALLKLPASTPRPVFHEITKDAVLKAVANPRQIDMARVHAQQARAVLDMMVGFTISPLLWKYVGPALSAGRCQTPALRLLADKEKVIESFSADTAWRMKGVFQEKAAFDANCVDDLEDEESAKNYFENVHKDQRATVTAAITKPYTELPPDPLITSSLQQEVSATMGLQPKNTMHAAQRLYEAGHITYMRTDCPVLSEEAKVAARELVVKEYGEAFVQTQATRISVPKKPAEVEPQQAHEAIRPTHFDLKTLPEDEDWSAADKKIYQLIWKRALQSVMSAAKGETKTITFTLNADEAAFDWRSTAKRQLFAGWRAVGAAATNLDEEEEATVSPWTALESVEAGTGITWSTLEAAPHVSKPATRYTEATLVRELERRSIGRPSTFATLVGAVVDKGYAEKRTVVAKETQVPRLLLNPNVWPPTRLYDMKKTGGEKNKMVPTALGLSVLEFCLREFGPLFAYDFTAKMEADLDAVAAGAEWKDVCRATWDSYKDRYAALKSGESTALQPTRSRMFGDIKAIQSKKGPLLLKEGPTPAETVFFGWPKGKAFGEITDAEVKAFVAEVAVAKATETLGTYNDQPILKKSGPFGPYAECAGVKIPLPATYTETSLQEAFAAKSVALHTLGPFEFRNGPYGVFMFKSDAKGPARKFVSVPSGVDPKTFTLEAATRVYQTGLQSKAKGAAYKKRNPK